MTVAKHSAYKLARDRREVPTDRMEQYEASSDAAEDDPAVELRRLRATLYSLPEHQHQAFVLRYWSGLSVIEIAGTLSLTPKAVESLLVRARASVLKDTALDDACT